MGDKSDLAVSPENEKVAPLDAVPPVYSNDGEKVGQVIKPQQRRLHDINVSLEEYMFYAERARAEEDLDASTAPKTTLKDVFFPSSGGGARYIGEDGNIVPERKEFGAGGGALEANLNDAATRAAVSDEEWTNASRALRSATAAAAFYLITTDILGPFGIGFSIATMGWGEGIGLFTLFGICAGCSGYLLWKVFMNVDSFEFPARNYGDLGFRIYGHWLRYIINFLQALQLILSVGIITISNGQSISQVSKGNLCYVICCLIWALIGFFLGQIRTLRKFGWLANFAIVLNLLIMFISMGVMAHSEPNYEAIAGTAGFALGGDSVTQDADGNWPPVQTFGGVPPSSNGFIGSINGLMQGVYAYAGAQLFVEFMAEMRRPRDFLKVMWGSQFFIYACYMIYGCYNYYFQGQYSNQLSYQGLSPYGWQTACNIIAVISGIIAATLYGNIGIKVIYNNVLVEMLAVPPLHTRAGKILWACIVPVYWSIAFVIAAAIPDFFGLTSVTAAVCFVQFTYTFPGMLGLGFFVQRNAMRGEEPFDPANGGRTARRDAGLKRLVRGFFGQRWWLNVILLIYILGSLVVSGLGAYSAIEGLIAAFETPQINAFTCQSPVA